MNIKTAAKIAILTTAVGLGLSIFFQFFQDWIHNTYQTDKTTGHNLITIYGIFRSLFAYGGILVFLTAVAQKQKIEKDDAVAEGFGVLIEASSSETTKLRINRFSIHQTSKVFTICYVAISLIFIPIGVIMIVGGQNTAGILYVLMPIIYGILGYPFVAFTCWIYNFVANGVGGIEFTVQKREMERSSANVSNAQTD